jgi:polyisoprenoid-binding protein YceI
MTDRYKLDPTQGRFTVETSATGMLSMFGHSPTFDVRDFAGEVRFEGGEVGRMALDLRVDAGSLVVRDRVSPADRREIESRMRRDVLESADYPEIAYLTGDVSADATAPGTYRVHLAGRLSLHGATRPRPIDAELRIFGDGLQLRGSCPLRMSDYGIRPVTALGGTIKLKDDLTISFLLVGLPEGS